MDSSFNVNEVLHSSIFSQNLSRYQNITVSYTGLEEMKQELSLSLVSCEIVVSAFQIQS